MGFGISLDVKVEVPKVNVAAAVSGAADAAQGAVTGAIGGAINSAKDAAGVALAALSTVAGAIADVEAAFKGLSVDVAMEPHLVLDANASYGDTNFQTGKIWIKIGMTAEEAEKSQNVLRLVSASGEFDQQLTISDDFVVNGNFVDIVFNDAPMDQSILYSLSVTREDGISYTLFEGVSYDQMCGTISKPQENPVNSTSDKQDGDPK